MDHNERQKEGQTGKQLEMRSDGRAPILKVLRHFNHLRHSLKCQHLQGLITVILRKRKLGW